MTSIIVCINCGKKNKFGIVKKHAAKLCKNCGMDLSTQNRSLPPGTLPISQQSEKKEVRKDKSNKKEKDLEKYSGDFKQFGVICLGCRAVTPFGKKKAKRCNTCNNKLRLSPRTVIFFNGQVEAVLCSKCKKYSDYKLPKCEHCNKKLKI